MPTIPGRRALRRVVSSKSLLSRGLRVPLHGAAEREMTVGSPKVGRDLIAIFPCLRAPRRVSRIVILRARHAQPLLLLAKFVAAPSPSSPPRQPPVSRFSGCRQRIAMVRSFSSILSGRLCRSKRRRARRYYTRPASPGSAATSRHPSRSGDSAQAGPSHRLGWRAGEKNSTDVIEK